MANDLEAHLITPDLTPTPGTEPGRAGVATAATVQPRIVSWAAWGADERIRRADPDYSDTVKAAFVHHTVQSNSYSPSESAALVRADYLYHVRTRGWNDVGYNFLVDRYGRVFEGRYGGVTRAVLGAHSGGFNTDTTGVALLGTFTTARPTSYMLAALERLLAWKLDLTHVDPRGLTVLTSAGGSNTRYPAGRRVVVNTILGHGSTSYRPARAAPPSGCCPPSGRPSPASGGPRSTAARPPPRGSAPRPAATPASTPASARACAGGSRSPAPTGSRSAPSAAPGPRPRSAGTAAPAAVPWPRPGGRP
jgi:hypothetical protein